MTCPTLGVCVGLDDLETHLDLVREHERDVEIQDFINPKVLNGDWRAAVARAKTLLGDHAGRVGIHGPFFDLPLAAADHEIAEVVRRRLNQALDALEALGGTHMVIHSPITTWDHFNEGVFPGAAERTAHAFTANVRPAAERAASMGAVLVLENIEDNDPAARVRLVERVGSAGIRVSLDTGHANYAHCQQGAPPVDAYVRAAGRFLAHVHLQDTDGVADRHWPPGEGNVPWRAVFRALNESTVLSQDDADRPRLMIELRDKSGLPAAISYLRGIGVAM